VVTYAVYVRQDFKPGSECIYGDPVLKNLSHDEAMTVARAFGNYLFGGPVAYEADDHGIIRRGLPGSPSMDILIWNESNVR
jgi:hypothetical protein